MAKNPATPPPTPNQNHRKPFPGWRLKNGLTNASQDELEEAVESCERTALWGALVLVIGIVAEVALAVTHPPYDSLLEQWGSSAANALVAIGVGVEVLFGRMGSVRQGELARRATDRLAEVEFANGFLEERVSQANERAAKSDLARAELETKLASRRLSQRESAKLSAALKTVKDRIPSLVLCRLRDAEAWAFAVDIAVSIQNAGIAVEMRDRTASSLMVYGVKVTDTSDGAIAQAFAGIDLGLIEYAINSAIDNQVIIVVGLKPPPL